MKSRNLISPDFVKEIKKKTNIVDWISENQSLTAHGKEFKGTCPFCRSKNANFMVFPNTQSFYCFLCKSGGDVITYLMKINNISYPEAVRMVAQKVGVAMEEPQKSEYHDYQVMNRAAEFYHSQLRVNQQARQAIDVLHSWGLYGQQIVDLKLGFNDNGFRSFMCYMQKKYRYSCEMLEKYQLLMHSEKGMYYDKMRDSVIIPISNVRNQVVAFDFYVLATNRYYRYPNTDWFDRTENLYSINIAIKSKCNSVIVVTTLKDYFALYSKGITNVVCTFGNKISEAQMLLLKKCFKVILLLTPVECNVSVCRSFCYTNNMYCEQIILKDGQTVRDYIENSIEDIKNIVIKFEKILNNVNSDITF